MANSEHENISLRDEGIVAKVTLLGKIEAKLFRYEVFHNKDEALNAALEHLAKAAQAQKLVGDGKNMKALQNGILVRKTINGKFERCYFDFSDYSCLSDAVMDAVTYRSKLRRLNQMAKRQNASVKVSDRASFGISGIAYRVGRLTRNQQVQALQCTAVYTSPGKSEREVTVFSAKRFTLYGAFTRSCDKLEEVSGEIIPEDMRINGFIKFLRDVPGRIADMEDNRSFGDLKAIRIYEEQRKINPNIQRPILEDDALLLEVSSLCYDTNVPKAVQEEAQSVFDKLDSIQCRLQGVKTEKTPSGPKKPNRDRQAPNITDMFKKTVSS